MAGIISEWTFDQGPFDDALAGTTDYSGWWYEPVRDPENQPEWCFRCGEALMAPFGEWCQAFCWACQNPVPWEWEQLHEDALIMTCGMLTS